MILFSGVMNVGINVGIINVWNWKAYVLFMTG